MPVLDQPHVNTAAAPRTLPASTCNPFSLPGLACSDEPCPAQPGRLLDPFSPNEILQAAPPPPPPLASPRSPRRGLFDAAPSTHARYGAGMLASWTLPGPPLPVHGVAAPAASSAPVSSTPVAALPPLASQEQQDAEGACMDQDPDSDDEEMEVFKLAALADDEREAQADAETRANEEAAAQDEANAEATAQAAQLYSLGLSDEEANAIMPKGKRPADSSGSSDDSSGSSDDGSCHGGGGGRKKKKRRQRKKKKGDVGEDESTDRANLVRLIGPARMAAFTAQHDTLPLEELRSVWRLHRQWDELLEVFYKIQGPPRCGNTKKKAVRNKLAQNEQQRRDIAAEILRIKKGEFDFRRDEEGVANAELRPAQLLSAAADDAKRLVSSGVRELAAGDSAKRACCKSSRCGACSCHSGDDDDEDSDDDDDEASFYSVDEPDLTSACIWL